MDYPGTLLLVSHDRFFLDQVSTHTLAWNAEGAPRWELYEGNPTAVRSLRGQRALEAAELAKPALVASKAAAVREAKARKAGLSQKEERRLAELEAAMALTQERIAALDQQLGDPGAFITADAPGHQALKDRDAAKAELEELELAWLELEEKRVP